MIYLRLVFGGNLHLNLCDLVFGSLLLCMALSPQYLLFITKASPKKLMSLQGFDPFSITCFHNTTYLVAILGYMATNVIIGSDMWALWPLKLCIALVTSSVARDKTIMPWWKKAVASMGAYRHS